MLIIGILLIFIVGHTSGSLDPDSGCADAAYCQMVLGDVSGLAGDKTKSLMEYEKGLDFLRRHKKFIECDIEQIEINCRNELVRCEINVKQILINIIKIPKHLITGCDVYTFPYTLLLCRYMKNWPTTKDVPEGFYERKQACDSSIIEYNDYHIYRGKLKEDYPPDWDQHIKHRKDLLELQKKDEFINYPPPTSITFVGPEVVKPVDVDENGDEIKKIIKKIITYETKHPEQKQNNKPTKTFKYEEWGLISYLEANPKPKFGKVTSPVDQQCPSFTYINAASYKFPYNFLAHCHQPDLTYEYNGENILYDKGYPLHNYIDACSRDKSPLHGSFIVGIKFIIRRDYVPGSLNRLSYLQEAAYFCSGLGWSKELRAIESNEKYSPELICPTMSAICSMRFQRYTMENTKSFITNIKFRCCSMPEDLYYSGIASVYLDKPKDEINKMIMKWSFTNKIFDNVSIKKVFVLQDILLIGLI